MSLKEACYAAYAADYAVVGMSLKEVNHSAYAAVSFDQ
jgi:hypothetical protein